MRKARQERKRLSAMIEGEILWIFAERWRARRLLSVSVVDSTQSRRQAPPIRPRLTPKNAAVYARLNRLLALRSALAGRSTTRVCDLEEELGVSRRTIYRDLQTLRAAGIDVRYDSTRGGHTSTNTVGETVPDAASLLVLLKHAVATALPATPGESRKVKAAAEALAERLPAVLRQQFDDFQRSVVVTTPEAESQRLARLFETFERATAADLCLTIEASLPRDATPLWHVVQPLRLGYDLAAGWRLEGLLADSHLTCRIGSRAILAYAVSDRPITRQLVCSKVEWTVADIEVI